MRVDIRHHMDRRKILLNDELPGVGHVSDLHAIGEAIGVRGSRKNKEKILDDCFWMPRSEFMLELVDGGALGSMLLFGSEHLLVVLIACLTERQQAGRLPARVRLLIRREPHLLRSALTFVPVDGSRPEL